VVSDLFAGRSATAAIEIARTTPTWIERLLILAVVLSHKAGNTWEQIGRALGVSRQSAHERYAGHVAAFHRDLGAVLDAIRVGTSVQDALDGLQLRDFPAGRTLVVDMES
jgi:hypothetical protein